MYQIDNSTAVASIPASTAAGTAGFFTDGNPATGVPATIMPAEYQNMLMMEIINVLSTASVTPSKSTFTQLATAIKTIIQSGKSTYVVDTGTANAYVLAMTPAITAYTDGLKVRGRVVNTSTGVCTLNAGAGAVALVGLAHAALQGGEMVAGGYFEAEYSSTLSKFILLWCTGAPEQVAPATQSQHALNLGQFLSGMTANDYLKIPVIVGGVARTIIIQWIQASAAALASGDALISTAWPIAFPNACFRSFPIIVTASSSAGPGSVAPARESVTPSTATLAKCAVGNGTTAQTIVVNILGIGW